MIIEISKFSLKKKVIQKTFRVDEILSPENIESLITLLLKQDIPSTVYPTLFGLSKFPNFEISMDPTEVGGLIKKIQERIWNMDINISSDYIVKDIHFKVSYRKPKDSYFLNVLLELLDFPVADFPSLNNYLNKKHENSENDKYLDGNVEMDIRSGANVIFGEYLPQIALPELLLDHIFLPAFSKAVYKNAVIFPAYRHAFALFPVRSILKSADLFSGILETIQSIAKWLKHTESRKDQGLTFDSLPGIIDDYISFLDELARSATPSSQAETWTLAKIAESILLGGGHVELREDSQYGAYIVYSHRDTTIELERSSSMVQQISPLILYLRFLANKGDLVIIDEPESNLHPEAQIRIAQLLVLMANAGLNVIVTTHSPYIVEYVTTLIDAYRIAEKLKDSGVDEREINDTIGTIFRESMGITYSGDILDLLISPEKVSAYFFGNSSISPITNAHPGEHKGDSVLEWETFAKVSDELEEFYDKLMLLDISLD